ncbi:MAG TPA: tetratricopeptide repeat protein [Chthoniobacterales bacterium]|nr:tetratricopeptide repeat protein [Chthoniobacterales bacterium]
MKLISRLRQFSPALPHYLFLGVLLFRLLCLERLSRSPLFLPARGDMHFYNEWALRIVRGEFDLHTAFYGLPLYPYFLALVYRIFGYSPFIPAVLQALADAGTAVLIYLLAIRLLRQPGHRSQLATKVFGALAALGWAFFVPAQAYSIVLMPTAWFIFVFWLVVWRLSSKPSSPAWKECLALGLLIGVTAMAIATVLFLIPLVAAAIFFKPARFGRAVWVGMAALLLGVGIGTAPCWIHNYVIARDPAFLSAHGGVNFWIGNNPTANGYPRFPPGLRAGQAAMLEDSISSAEAAAGHRLKRAEVSAYWSAKANDYIASHPWEWLRLVLIKARNFWNAFQYDDLSIITNLREQRVIFPGLYFGLVAALALAGMVLAWRKSPASRWITVAIGLHMIALLSVFITERYRLPIVPGLLILATYGLWMLWQYLLGKKYVHAVGYAMLVLVCAIFVSWPQRDPALWALDAYNSGWQAYECNNLSLAEEKLTLARRYVPTNPETNFAFGNLRLKQGNQPAAASFYLQTLQLDDNHRGALNNLAVIALDQQRYDLAEPWLRKAEQIDPRNAKTHFLLAKTLLAKGDKSGAQREATRATTLQPGQREFRQLSEELGQSSD